MQNSPTLQWISTTPDHPWEAQETPAPETKGLADLFATGRTDQIWRGFGGCFNELGARAFFALDANAQKVVLEELFSPDGGCGFNLARLPIGASDYATSWYSLNENENDLAMEHFSIERDRRLLLPYVQSALRCAPDLNFFASPWSPPTWMKSPPAHNFGVLRMEPAILDSYALYFLRYLQAYRSEGVNVTSLHVQNEPNSDQKFPSCVWTGEKMRDFIRDHLGPLFEREKETCEIWAGTIERESYDAWANTILSDEKARRFIRGVGYQWAGKGAVQRTHQSWPELPISQTENECGDGKNTWDYAHYVFDLLHHYITNGVSAYYYWNMILQPEGPSTWGWKQNSMITVDLETGKLTYNPEFYVMKHVSHFIRPGAVRLEVSGYWAANALAFRNSDGVEIYVVRNPLKEKRSLTLSVSGKIRKFYLPARSINTISLNRCPSSIF